jgi:hypothetical protein
VRLRFRHALLLRLLLLRRRRRRLLLLLLLLDVGHAMLKLERESRGRCECSM